MSVSEASPSVSTAVPPSTPASPLVRLAHRLFEPVNIGMVVFFRVCFGAVMLWECYRYFSYGWIPRNFIDPPFHFTYWGFAWVKPWPGDGMYYHWGAMAVLATCIMLGLFYRAATVLFAFAFAYIFLIDQTYYLNHFYLITLISFLMIFIPAHTAGSLDVLRKPSIRSYTIPVWTLWLLRTQIGIAYFYGGLAKLNADWFRGEPMRSVLLENPQFPLIGQWFAQEWMTWAFVWGGVLLDLLVVPFLLWPRTRVAAYTVAVLFHLMNSILFHIGIFPWFMTAATLIFFPPDWMKIEPRAEAPDTAKSARRRKKEARNDAAAPATPSLVSGRLTTGQRWTVGLLTAYLLFQFLMPFRHFLYPGNVSWTEEGHYYAWHMKLRRKHGMAQFHGITEDGRRVEEYEILDKILDGERTAILTDRQRGKMSGRPDMLRLYAEHLAREWERKGHGRLEVYANAVVSLNGRSLQPIVDPNRDLARVGASLWPVDWILPLETELPSSPVRRADEPLPAPVPALEPDE